MTSHIQIKTSGNKTEVFIDGKKINGVRKVKFEKEAINAPVLKIDLLASDMEIDTNIIPELPEVFRGFYEPKESPE